MHDFDLEFADGRAEAVEVTEAALQLLRLGEHQARRMGYNLPVSGLTRAWTVFSTQRSVFKRWDRGRLASLLAALEHQGIQRAGVGNAGRILEARALSGEFAIQFAISHATGATDRVVVFPPGDDRIWSSHPKGPGAFARAALEEESFKEDNRRKLAASGTSERHLFVWSPPENGLVWRDLEERLLPTVLPALPSEITTGWLATEDRNRNVVAWRASLRRGWEIFELGMILRRCADILPAEAS